VWQTKRYYGTLIASRGRSKRIRNRAQSNGQITMTSFPFRKNTSLTQKMCISDKKLPWNSN